MSDQRIFAKYRAIDIRNELQIIEGKRTKDSVSRRKHILRKVISNLTQRNYIEMILLLPDILDIWRVEDDLEIKQMCHEYIRTIGSLKPRSTVDALDLIKSDLKSAHEKMQITALVTLCSIPFSVFTETAFNFISELLGRHNIPPQLMKTAIESLLLLEEFDHDGAMSILSRLYEIVDQQTLEPTVVIAALATLQELHETEPDLRPLQVSVKATFSLLDLLPELDEWDKSKLLNVLPTTVVPEFYDDAYEMIDIVLPQLQHVNTSVALNALKFILYLIDYTDRVRESTIKQLSSSIISLLEKPPELQFLVLRNVILLLLSRGQAVLDFDVTYFFISYSDPIYIKDTKLECLYLLANDSTLPQILDQLEQYATDIDVHMSRKAIRAIGNLAVKLGSDSVDKCVDTLSNLLEFGVDYVIQEVISVFKNILRKYPERFKTKARMLVKYMSSAQGPESKNAMIWIITQYSDILPDYLELFKVYCDDVLEEAPEIQFSILSSSVKFFVRNPSPETEQTCLNLLKLCTEKAHNPDLRDRALIYWRLLTYAKQNSNVLSNDTVREIVDGELPMIELNTNLDPIILEELELNIGSVTSIYLKPTAQVFRLNKTKSLPQSPILNPVGKNLNVVADLLPSRDLFEITEGKRIRLPGRSFTAPQKVPTMSDYDKPAEKVNTIKDKRKSSMNTPAKIARNPSMLIRKLTLKKKF